MKKVGRNKRQLRYDLNEIPYDYTMEVMNRFMGLNMIAECLTNYGQRFMTLYRRQTVSKKKKYKKAKWLFEEDLQIAEKRREAKSKGEKERYTHLNAEFQRITRRDKKAFLSDQCKQRKTIEWERLEISARKLETPREHFMQRWAE